MTRKYKKHQGKERHRGPGRTAPIPVSRLAPPIDLIDLAGEIEQAEKMLNTRLGAKLKVIADQIRALQQEARSVLEEARRDQDLHRVCCSFTRCPGQIYHLYKKDGDIRYFSLLSPDEWGGNPPHPFLGSYRLETDMSWTPTDKLDKPDDTKELVRRLLNERDDQPK